MAKKEESKDLLENADAIQGKLEGIEHWAERNPKILIAIAAVLVLTVGGYFGWRYYIDSQEAEAQKQMYQAVHYFEADSLNLAFSGDGNNAGFKEIAENFGLTPAGKLASFYAGAICLKQAKYSLAIYYLEDYKADDLLIQPRAYSLIGDAYMEQKDYENASKWYDKASGYKPTKEFTPYYLMKAGLAYEKLNKNDKAKEIYQKVIDAYWESAEVQNAKKYKARLETNS